MSLNGLNSVLSIILASFWAPVYTSNAEAWVYKLSMYIHGNVHVLLSLSPRKNMAWEETMILACLRPNNLSCWGTHLGSGGDRFQT